VAVIDLLEEAAVSAKLIPHYTMILAAVRVYT